MKGLQDKVAIVTGGERGIGRSIVDAFRREGATVASIDVRRGDGEESGAGAAYFEADVSDDEGVGRVVAAIDEKYGRIDVLVSNAGISGRQPFSEISMDDWNRMIAVNLTGVFVVSRHVVPVMKRGGSGRIINVASQLAQLGGSELVHYCASKAGVVGLTKALARELAPSITVNAIAPGPILTDMVKGREDEWFERTLRALPLERLGTPEEVAPSAVFLAGAGGALYTGQTLGPNSGHVMP